MFRIIFMLVATVILSGCATYGDRIYKALELTKNGDYGGAKAIIIKNLSPDGKDRLLYYMELGVLEHLNGNYKESIELFERAERIGEDLYTKKVNEIMASAIISPSLEPYRGADYERVLINYYKAINFLMLAQQADKSTIREDAFEGVRIEVRRLEMNLTAISNEKGSYSDQKTNLKDKNEALFSKISNLFNSFIGGSSEKSKLVYRQDAWANYLSGLTYEQGGEYDNARISYQKAANLYEDGFQEQYKLDKSITEQAWFDTIRMMRKGGGWQSEWSQLAKKKLSSTRRSELNTFDSGAQVVVIEHVGFAPHRKELKLVFGITDKAFVLRLNNKNTLRERAEQSAWLSLMYANKGILDLIQNYNVGSIDSDFAGMRANIGSKWNIAESIGLVGALSKSNIFVSMPYYPPFKKGPGASTLKVSGNSYPLVSGESIAQLALQEQLLSASKDMIYALAREAVKSVVIHLMTQKRTEDDSQLTEDGNQSTEDDNQLAEDNNQLIGLAEKVMAYYMSAPAETRNWLTLPYEIRIARVSVEVGKHQLILNSKPNLLLPEIVSKKQINLKKGDIFVWKQRSIPAKK